MILVPGGAIGALLKSYCPKRCVAAESLGLILDVISVNTSGKAGVQITQLPLGDNSSPWGDNAVCM
jgi:hypothetical protein